jgi:hypothetical protein
MSASIPKMALIPLHIRKTEGEWKLINDKIGNKRLARFIEGQIRKIESIYSECPDCVSKADGKRTTKRPYISSKSYKKIEKIAKLMDIPVSSAVDILIIMPLLNPMASEIRY